MEIPLEGMIMKSRALINLVFHYSPDERAYQRDKVHVWLLDLDKTYFEYSDSLLLSNDELQRTARLKDPLNRKRLFNRFILARNVFAKITGETPKNISFIRGEHGKPRLAFTGDQAFPFEIRFNLSHSQNVLAIAVAYHVEVGIDVEVIDVSEGNISDYIAWITQEAIAKLTGKGIASRQTAPNPDQFETETIQLRFSDKDIALAIAVPKSSCFVL